MRRRWQRTLVAVLALANVGSGSAASAGAPPKKAKKPVPASGAKRARAGVVRTKVPSDTDTTKINKATRGSSLVVYMESLEEIHRAVDAIAIGTPLDAFVNRRHFAYYVLDGLPEPMLDSVWSVGRFQIEKVLYQNANHGITELGAGQVTALAESAGLVDINGQIVLSTLEEYTPLKQNSRYVVFLRKQPNGGWGIINLEMGRFNTDGNDLNDNPGSPTWKQGFRDELTAAYQVTFATPTTEPPSIVRATAAPVSTGGAGALTLVVEGADFKNGAIVHVGKRQRPATFVSATRLSVRVRAADLPGAGGTPVIVTNPDGKASPAYTYALPSPGPAKGTGPVRPGG